MSRTALYARVSTRRQEQEATIESQLAQLRSYAQGQGYDLGAYEYESGQEGDTTPATVPTGLIATAVSSTQINLSWVDLVADPWNPVAGTNWSWDQGAIYATQSDGLMADPSTGLTWPLRIERAEVIVQSGVAVRSTHDWVTVETAGSITVPSDAWVDWDANSQTFITAGSGKTAKLKSVVYYPDDLFETVRWHDGSPLSVGDFVLSMIMIFDPAKTGSSVYDETNAPQFDTFMETFKGMRIASTDP